MSDIELNKSKSDKINRTSENIKFNIATFLSISFLIAVSAKGILEVLLLRSEDFGDPIIFGPFRFSLLVSIVLFWACFLTMSRNQAISRFTDQSWTELRTVTWPERAETIRSTVVVIAVTLFIAFMLGLYDFVWTKVASETLFAGSEEQEESK